MDYQRHYDALMQRAKGRSLDNYVERHHIVPRCLGGSDDPENIAVLTPEEHYVAHQLLVKIRDGNHKLAFAALMMTRGNSRNNKLYGWLSRKASLAISKTHKGRDHSDEHNQKVSAALKGKKKSPEHVRAMSEARKAMHYTPELREKLAANRGKKMNENQRAALLAAHKGRVWPEEIKQKWRVPKGPQQPVSCPHCNKEGGISLMKRWHFDNCKVAVNG